MNLRLLAFVAIVLGVLLACVVYLGLDRLGHLQEWGATDWEFRNHLLEAPLGTRVIVRSVNVEAPQERFWFDQKITDPRVDRTRPPQPGDTPPLPNVMVWRETRAPAERNWHLSGPPGFVVLGLMGARSTTEWLEEIRPVRERLPGGGSRILIRATYGQQVGGSVSYFYDPEEPTASPRGFGWLRMEAFVTDLTEVSYTIPAGAYLPGGKK